MKNIVVFFATIILLGLAVVTLAACGGGSGGVSGGSDESAVRNVVAQELAAIRKKDWRGLYDLHMHDSRYSCAYSTFLEDISVLDDIDTSKFDYVDVNVSVTGEKATASLVQKYSGQPDKPLTGHFEKVNGSWYVSDDPCT